MNELLSIEGFVFFLWLMAGSMFFFAFHSWFKKEHGLLSYLFFKAGVVLLFFAIIGIIEIT